MPSEAGADRTQRLLDALSSPVRREILWLVWEREFSAGEIAAAFAQGAPTISAHLAVLRDAGLVSMTRDGTFRRYRARQAEVRSLRDLLGSDRTGRAGGSEPGPYAPSRLASTAVVAVDVAVDVHDAFRAFTDAELYSRWAGMPVTLVDGQFATTTEWGLEVRGTYDLVVPPRLIVMRWDFAVDAVPVPGDARRGYLELTPTDRGCRVEVVQLAPTDALAHRFERAWGLMLARLRDNARDVLHALDAPVPATSAAPARRPSRDRPRTARAPSSRPRGR